MQDTTSTEIATLGWIEDLVDARTLTVAQARAAASVLSTATPARQWADRLLALAGTTLILAGVVFFFAYNWRGMSPFQKIGLIDLALLLMVAVTVRVGVENLAGRCVTLAAAVLVGVYLAVVGQIYQSGADPWQLFAAWGLLITPWCLVVPFAGLWALWLTIIDAALFRYADLQVLNGTGLQALIVACTHGAALAAREATASRLPEVARETWLRQFIIGGALFMLTMPAAQVLSETGSAGDADWAAFAAWLATVAAICSYYRKRDLFPLSMAAFSVCIVAVCALGVHILPHSDLGGWFLFALLVIAIFSAAGGLLRHAMQTLRAAGKDLG